MNIKQAMGPKIKSGGGGIAARFGGATGNLMVPSGSMAHNLSSSDMAFDNPANISGMSKNADAS